MIRHGFAPFMECSTRGDRRFSAFCAKIKFRGNKSIEELYQAYKKFEDGETGLDWKRVKEKQSAGIRVVNMDQAHAFYRKLWQEFMAEHPELEQDLLQASGLSDMFGQPGRACQATELWRIRSSLMLQSIKTHGAGSIRVTSKRPYSGAKPGEEEAVIDVDRTNTVLGNPFVLYDVNDDKARYRVIDQYREKLFSDLKSNGPMAQEVKALSERLMHGEDICLNCWCEPKPCHAEVIADAAIERAYRMSMSLDLGIFACEERAVEAPETAEREVYDIPGFLRKQASHKASIEEDEPSNRSSIQRSLF